MDELININDVISRQKAFFVLHDLYIAPRNCFGAVFIESGILMARNEIMKIPCEYRKTGKWEHGKNNSWICSECGYPSVSNVTNILYRFCPNCGAKMEG